MDGLVRTAIELLEKLFAMLVFKTLFCNSVKLQEELVFLSTGIVATIHLEVEICARAFFSFFFFFSHYQLLRFVGCLENKF